MTKGSFLIDVSLIQDAEDQRIRQNYSHVESLAKSIEEVGLIQPIVITTDYKIVDGCSRLKACRDILKMSQVPVVIHETMSEEQLRILEIEANIRRKDFDWTERVMGIAKVHEIQKFNAALNHNPAWTIQQTGQLLGHSVGNVQNFVTLAKYIKLQDEEICKASGVSEALKVLLKRRETEANQKLVELMGSRKVSVPQASAENTLTSELVPVEPVQTELPINTISLRDFCKLGDCFTHMAEMPEASIDHVFTDIPYGIDMENLDQTRSLANIDTVKREHDVTANVAMMEQLFKAVFRITKPHSFFILWYDLSHHEKLQAWALEAGWCTQRWPLIWHKLQPCWNQAANFNTTKDFEVAMICRKPKATLVNPHTTSVKAFAYPNTQRTFDHPFAKPIELWQWLMKLVSLQGQSFYDPFAGCGSSLVAGIQLGLVPHGSEIVEGHYNKQLLYVAETYKKLIPNVQFL